MIADRVRIPAGAAGAELDEAVGVVLSDATKPRNCRHGMSHRASVQELLSEYADGTSEQIATSSWKNSTRGASIQVTE